MGLSLSSSVAPVSDDRCQRCMQTFLLTKADMGAFWEVFKRHDVNQRAMISMSAFYETVVHEPRTIFGDGLFDLIDADDGETLDFGEFVSAIATYCFFEIPELLKFAFFVFDRKKKGFVTQEEFRLFIGALHQNAVSPNVLFALDHWKYRPDGKFYFKDLVKMHSKFPSVLFPAFRLQSAMMHTVGGEHWWARRKTKLLFAREAKLKKDTWEKTKDHRQALRYRQQQVRRHMGSFAFYCMPWQRSKYYTIYPLPTEHDDFIFEKGGGGGDNDQQAFDKADFMRG